MAEASLQLHRDHAHGAEAEAQELMQNYDKNADSSLSKEELSAAIHHNQAKNPGSHNSEAKKKDVAPKAQKVPGKAAEEKGANELTGIFPNLACSSAQSKASKALPPQHKVNSKPPKVTSKAPKEPKEKVKAKGDESHASTHKVKEPKTKPDGKAKEHPLHKDSSKWNKDPAKKRSKKSSKILEFIEHETLHINFNMIIV
ncbi:hypothetical protein SDJN03_18391, partial [Cucurbita argyrosperma subsp. sororia]